MDFSKFLLNDSQQKKSFIPRKILPKDTIDTIDIQPPKKHIQTTKNIKTPPNTLPEQNSFKKGDFIVIIGVENSPLNIYKGYFGEIIYFIYRNNSAYIILEGINNSNPLQFPFGHFKHR